MLKMIHCKNLYQSGKFIKDHALIFDNSIKGICPMNDVESWLKNHHMCGEVQWIECDKAQYVVPGFIDVHIHGCMGRDTMDGSVESLQIISKEIAKHGVTSFLPTTMTMPLESIEKALDVIRLMKIKQQKTSHEMRFSERQYGSAKILGVHLEGPIISSQYKGAQKEDAIQCGNDEMIRWLKTQVDIVKVMTIAPEVEGAMNVIKQLVEDVTMSIGHTGASYEEAIEARQGGAKGITHFFNAMTGLHHRSPGVVGAGMTEPFYCECIADGIHIAPEIFNIIVKGIGLERVILITDCISGGGLGEGSYQLGGQKVLVDDGRCFLEDGTLAGSVLTLDQALRNFMIYTNLPLEKVIPLVTSNPATYLNIADTIGSLEVGKWSDIVLLDANYQVVRTFVDGN